MNSPTRIAPDVRFVRVDEALADVFLGFVEEYYAFDGIAFDAGDVRRGLAHLIENPVFGDAWLIADGERFVGHFVLAFGFDLEFGGQQATVTDLYLAETARARGIGRATIAFVERTLVARGVHALELQVERDNLEAQAFYRRVGMIAHDRIPMSKRLSRSLLPK